MGHRRPVPTGDSRGRVPHKGPPPARVDAGARHNARMRIRPAVPGDAPGMGRVMVASWLAAHRGQMPDEAWRQRVDEWTPQVSADGWARLMSEQAAGEHPRTVLLVVEDDDGGLEAVALGSPAEGDESGTTAAVDAIYVRTDRQGQGVGRRLLRAMADELAGLGFTRLTIGVLSANRRARAFYEAMGGRDVAARTFDEEGHPLPGRVYEWSDLARLGR